MTDSKKETTKYPAIIPRVLADFGGRRKIFERRLKQAVSNLLERRSGQDRRSGFDRRKALNGHCQDLPDRRANNTD